MNATLACPTCPPTDGTSFIAEARVFIEEDCFLSVEPVIGRMRFNAAGELVWALGGLAVRQFAGAQVTIDGWCAAPQPGRTFAWLREEFLHAWEGAE